MVGVFNVLAFGASNCHVAPCHNATTARPHTPDTVSLPKRGLKVKVPACVRAVGGWGARVGREGLRGGLRVRGSSEGREGRPGCRVQRTAAAATRTCRVRALDRLWSQGGVELGDGGGEFSRQDGNLNSRVRKKKKEGSARLCASLCSEFVPPSRPKGNAHCHQNSQPTHHQSVMTSWTSGSSRFWSIL